MARKRFDAGLKDVIEAHAADWAALLGASAIRSVRMIDADVSTISAAADKAMLIDDGGPQWILHPELLSGRDLTLPRKIWWYNSVFHWRHACRVRSVVVLLRPAADGTDLTGEYTLRFPEDDGPYHVFRYRVLRLWKLPAEQFLKGGIGILPLATLADDAAGALPEVVARIDERLRTETDGDEANKLRSATSILMGLRHSPELIERVLQGVSKMWDDVYEDSSIVQRAVKRAQEAGEKRGEQRGELRGEQRGELRGQVRGATTQARKLLVRLGHAKFGPPSQENLAVVEAINDVDRLEALSERMLSVNSWEELLSAH